MIEGPGLSEAMGNNCCASSDGDKGDVTWQSFSKRQASYVPEDRTVDWTLSQSQPFSKVAVTKQVRVQDIVDAHSSVATQLREGEKGEKGQT